MDYDIEDSNIKFKRVDYLRDRCELDKPVDYDNLKRGVIVFYFKKTALPATVQCLARRNMIFNVKSVI